MSAPDPTPTHRGRLITLEGGEGAGKSLQGQRLVAALGQAGVDVALTREPGGSPGAEGIRQLLVTGGPDRWDPISEALLLNAARRDHWQHVLEPNLARGTWVVCDRFVDSTLAYQGAAGGVDITSLRQLHELSVNGLWPDLTFVLDLPVTVGLGRKSSAEAGPASDENRFEQMVVDFHQRVREGFLTLAANEPERIVVLDATRDPQSIAEEIFARTRARLFTPPVP